MIENNQPTLWGDRPQRSLRILLLLVVGVGVIGAVATGGVAANTDPAEISVNDTTAPIGEPFNSYEGVELRMDQPDSHEWTFSNTTVTTDGGTEIMVSSISDGNILSLDPGDVETAFGGSDQISLDIMIDGTVVAETTMSIEDPTTDGIETFADPSGAPINSSFAEIGYSSDQISANSENVTVSHDGSELSSSEIGDISTFDGIRVQLSSEEIDEEVGTEIGSTAEYSIEYDGVSLGSTTIERVDPQVRTVEIDESTSELANKSVTMTLDESKLDSDSEFVDQDRVTIELVNETDGVGFVSSEYSRSENETTNLSIPEDQSDGFWEQAVENEQHQNLSIRIPESGVEKLTIGNDTIYEQSNPPLGSGSGSGGNQMLILVVIAGAAAVLLLND